MLFSSISFLYYFLPILLLVYFIVPSRYKNFVLLIFSLLFYFYGEPRYIWILLFSCILNYLVGHQIGKHMHTKYATVMLVFSILMNVGLLLYFKYTNFLITNINQIFSTDFSLLTIVMPIGISFFTFQTLGYVIDVYLGKVKYSTKFLDFSTYVTLFPQLIAGPIVRYTTIEKELQERTHSYSSFAKGVQRFVIGLSKKVLLANVLGEFCKHLDSISTVLSSWLHAIASTLQIYFDFSGYSDMAIGLGLMFGFHFLENFNYPLIAKSITDFWRRWHISLSSWLKDYVYIPLGGSRVAYPRWILNLFIVWFLTGLWHGASWNFILWGLYFAILLLIEKTFLLSHLKKHPMIAHLYTIFFVICSFVIFNCESIDSIVIAFQNLFGIHHLPFLNHETLYYLRSYLLILVTAMIAATPLLMKWITMLKQTKAKFLFTILEPMFYMILLLTCTAFLIDSSFNPFLYFRF